MHTHVAAYPMRITYYESLMTHFWSLMLAALIDSLFRSASMNTRRFDDFAAGRSLTMRDLRSRIKAGDRSEPANEQSTRLTARLRSCGRSASVKQGVKTAS
ncbi:hypothetical protein [Paraburkholderia ribeironis]|nr:hypothetical protein [Paraburkholderia ribeironis]